MSAAVRAGGPLRRTDPFVVQRACVHWPTRGGVDFDGERTSMPVLTCCDLGRAVAHAAAVVDVDPPARATSAQVLDDPVLGKCADVDSSARHEIHPTAAGANGDGNRVGEAADATCLGVPWRRAGIGDGRPGRIVVGLAVSSDVEVRRLSRRWRGRGVRCRRRWGGRRSRRR